MGLTRFSPDVARKVGHYVYLYIDPETEDVFYVGKGRGNRAFTHLEDDSEHEKVKRIRRLRSRGLAPRIELLAHGLEDERTAFRVEAAVIDLLGKHKLTNNVRGWKTGLSGRMTAEQVEAHYGARDVEIIHPVLLIRVNRLFRYGMTAVELYDATRGVWVLGPNREKVDYALAVFEGVVQEVYRIRGCYPAGSTLSSRGKIRSPGRWEFVGDIAGRKVRDRYVFKSVRHHLSPQGRNPVQYVNVD